MRNLTNENVLFSIDETIDNVNANDNISLDENREDNENSYTSFNEIERNGYYIVYCNIQYYLGRVLSSNKSTWTVNFLEKGLD